MRQKLFAVLISGMFSYVATVSAARYYAEPVSPGHYKVIRVKPATTQRPPIKGAIIKSPQMSKPVSKTTDTGGLGGHVLTPEEKAKMPKLQKTNGNIEPTIKPKAPAVEKGLTPHQKDLMDKYGKDWRKFE